MHVHIFNLPAGTKKSGSTKHVEVINVVEFDLDSAVVCGMWYVLKQHVYLLYYNYIFTVLVKILCLKFLTLPARCCIFPSDG